MQAKKIRRHDLDWLRVLVFALLIIYHVGMFFVNWDWHIKNNEINYDLGWPMAFINRWRLHILFVISGMGSFYALSFRSGGKFIKERLSRLGIPLVAGVLLIVPPQVYFERKANNEFSGSYLDFLSSEMWTSLTWNHLWFLPYLLVFSLVLTPVFIKFRNHPDHSFLKFLRKLLKYPMSLFLFVIPLYFVEAFMEPYFPVTHMLVNDWFAFTNFLILFFYGFLLICLKDAFWKALDKIKWIALLAGILSFTAQVKLWYLEDTAAKHYFEAFIYALNFWSWILAILGFAAKYLNRTSRYLSYANRAVYPFYILHQTITIILAYYIKDLEWNFISKFSFLIIGTFGICWLLYEFLIRRIKFLHPIFGLKPLKQNKS